MTVFETILLGIVQGLTEFLPISSSGHLVIFQHLLGFREPELLLDCTLHLGTLTAVFLYFRSDIRRILSEILRGDFRGPNAGLAWMVAIGTLPTAGIGLAFRDSFERLFASVPAVGVMLLVTGAILVAGRVVPSATRRGSRGPATRVGLLTAVAVGTAQGMAILPGISRSGTTIAAGLLCGLDRELAGRFSFLLSIPAIIGAMVLQLDASVLERVGAAPLFWGFGASAAVGFLALNVLMGMVRKGHLHYFAPYCWAAGLFALVYSF